MPHICWTRVVSLSERYSSVSNGSAYWCDNLHIRFANKFDNKEWAVYLIYIKQVSNRLNASFQISNSRIRLITHFKLDQRYLRILYSILTVSSSYRSDILTNILHHFFAWNFYHSTRLPILEGYIIRITNYDYDKYFIIKSWGKPGG